MTDINIKTSINEFLGLLGTGFNRAYLIIRRLHPFFVCGSKILLHECLGKCYPQLLDTAGCEDEPGQLFWPKLLLIRRAGKVEVSA